MLRIPRLMGWPLALVTVLCAGCEIRDASPEAHTEVREKEHKAGSMRGGAEHHPIAFVDGFEQGSQLARAEQKPMLLFFTATWCKYCQQMAKETLVHNGVVQLSQKFVCVRIDADAEPEVCREFDVRSFPTVQFVSARGVRINRVTGKQPAQRFASQMEAALQAISRRPERTIPR
ncbi:MAG TPA: thioredoxin family protein [Pirellulales bacterium]|nr:thioredoxin family protein [Pirellulales bacterium]